MAPEDRLKVKVITVDSSVYDGDADSVTGVGVEGEFTVLRSHVSFMTPLEIGVLTIRNSGKQDDIALHGGFLRVDDNRVTILADAAERARDINVERAKAARERAENMLRKFGEEHPGLDDAGAALRRALLRLRVAGRD